MKIGNSVAIITGGASGLGEATARTLVESGGKAAILDLDESKGRNLAEELGRGAIFCKTDVTDETSVQAAVDATIEAFGAIHILVNCAGVGSAVKVLDKEGKAMPIGPFAKTVQINLIGTMNLIRLSAEKMVRNTPNEEGEKGVVVDTASVAAFEGQIGQAAYASSKAAIVGLTLPVAREFADYGIRVNTVAPGLFKTPLLAGLPEKAQQALGQMMPFPKRLGNPPEFAALVRHIVENPMLNGETIRLDAALRMAAR